MNYKERPVVCGNDEHDFDEKSVSAVADCTVAKKVTCMCLQQGGEINHLDFDSAFSNGQWDHPMYV